MTQAKDTKEIGENEAKNAYLLITNCLLIALLPSFI